MAPAAEKKPPAVTKGRRTGVGGGLLCRNLLKANALTQLPPSVQKQLRTVYRTTAAANVRIRPILEKSLKALNREEVPCVLLKGAALNLEVYDDPGLRGMSDIDIWIPEYHAPHGEKILVDLGYRPDPLYPTTYRNGTVTIDVHSHFLGADRIRSRKRIFGATAGEVLRRSVPVTVGKSRALSLDPLDQVLFLWLHALKHNLGKLAWLADIHCITAPWGASDWHGFQERCRMLGHTTSEISLRWFLEYLEGKRSRVTEQRFSRLGILRRYVFRQFIECGAMPQWAPFLLFLPPGKPHDSIRIILESVYPRPEILHQSFPTIPRTPRGGCMSYGRCNLAHRLLSSGRNRNISPHGPMPMLTGSTAIPQKGRVRANPAS